MSSVEVFIFLACICQLGHGLTCYKCTYGTSGCSAVPFDGSASGVTTDYQYLGHTCDFCYTIHVPQDDETVKSERGCAEDGVTSVTCTDITYSHTDNGVTQELQGTKCTCVGNLCNGDDYDSGASAVHTSVWLTVAVFFCVWS